MNSATVASSSASTAAEVTTLDRLAPYVLSLVRLVAGVLFFEHGLSKLTGFPQPGHMPSVLTLMWFAGIIETVGGGLVALGLFTRVAAFIMSGEMALAYFMVHAQHGPFPILNGGDAAILYCFIFFYFVFAGAGAVGLDTLLFRRR